jgi:pSer/pThr/pTyr-binding forkhead associated (FHA) protein
MGPQVILRATEGILKGKEFVFSGRALCVVGRSRRCSLRMPDGDGSVSRYHCLLDIDAPAVRVQDLGSLNGTYVNGEKIGQRDPGQSAQEAARFEHPTRALRPGDKLQVGNGVFRVDVVQPAQHPDNTQRDAPGG